MNVSAERNIGFLTSIPGIPHLDRIASTAPDDGIRILVVEYYIRSIEERR